MYKLTFDMRHIFHPCFFCKLALYGALIYLKFIKSVIACILLQAFLYCMASVWEGKEILFSRL